jgi:hypothetical protein
MASPILRHNNQRKKKTAKKIIKEEVTTYKTAITVKKYQAKKSTPLKSDNERKSG